MPKVDLESPTEMNDEDNDNPTMSKIRTSNKLFYKSKIKDKKLSVMVEHVKKNDGKQCVVKTKSDDCCLVDAARLHTVDSPLKKKSKVAKSKAKGSKVAKAKTKCIKTTRKDKNASKKSMELCNKSCMELIMAKLGIEPPIEEAVEESSENEGSDEKESDADEDEDNSDKDTEKVEEKTGEDKVANFKETSDDVVEE